MPQKKQSKNKTRKRKSPLLVLFLGALIVTAVACEIEFKWIEKIPTVFNKQEATQEEIKDKESTKEETPIVEGPENKNDEKEKTQNEGEDPNAGQTITGNITYLNAANEKLTIRVNLDQYLNSGVCKLKLTNGNNHYNDDVAIIDSASTSTCEGFDIPLGKLSSGKWTIEINLSANGKTGKITGEINL